MIKKKIFALLLLITTNICFSSYAKNLKGLMPIDVYSKMEKRGFTTESSYIADEGDLWINKKLLMAMNIKFRHIALLENQNQASRVFKVGL